MNVRMFGITREIVGADELTIPAEAGVKTVASLKRWLAAQHPRFGALRSLAVAVNHEYAEDDLALDSHAEIALIPPVSGG